MTIFRQAHLILDDSSSRAEVHNQTLLSPVEADNSLAKDAAPVNREQVKILQQADSIYIEEIRSAGLYDQISQAFAVLLPVKAVGVMGDKRTYEQVIALCAVPSEDFMTADWCCKLIVL